MKGNTSHLPKREKRYCRMQKIEKYATKMILADTFHFRRRKKSYFSLDKVELTSIHWNVRKYCKRNWGIRNKNGPCRYFSLSRKKENHFWLDKVEGINFHPLKHKEIIMKRKELRNRQQKWSLPILFIFDKEKRPFLTRQSGRNKFPSTET